jgi:gamma-glutamyltranspeptidase/glutathione hydrolase
MSAAEQGVVAAGHPLTAEAGARVLREGGNAVDAAVAAMLASFAAEQLLTGLGAGGYMLVAGAGEEPVLLDFFVEAPSDRMAPAGDESKRSEEVEGAAAADGADGGNMGGGGDGGRRGDGGAAAGPPPAELKAVDVSFGDAAQAFHIGPASCGVYGTPAGVCAAIERWGSMPLAELAAPAARLARNGVELNAGQAYIAKILTDLLTSTPECAALWAPAGHVLREGELLRNPELGDALALLGDEGAEPFYRGEIAAKVYEWMRAHGAALSSENLAGYRAVAREPVRVRYRDREVLTNPPPSAGGTLLAYALALLDRGPAPPGLGDVVAAMGAAQGERTAEFVEGLSEIGFLERFLARRLGSTTHISVLDRDGRACSVTCSNGEGSGVVVPGTGIHLNNVMGEQDLNPLGFHRHPAGRRMPSMMAPTVVTREGEVELVLGSAGSNRIRSALLQTIVGVVDHGLTARAAVQAPRVHPEDGTLYAEPGIDLDALSERRVDPHTTADPGAAPGSGPGTGPATVVPEQLVEFHDLNLFFGGVQAVLRRDRAIEGAGDPRRGGVAVRA